MKRDKQIDIMLLIGIIFVVMGHKYQPKFLFYPAYMFNMALFFFISGYLTKPFFSFSEKISFIRKKFKTQCLRYFKYNLFFSILTYILYLNDIKLGKVIDFSSNEKFLLSLKFFLFILFLMGINFIC